MDYTKTPCLSFRGRRALNRPPLLKCALFENQYSQENIKGSINLGVAENSLNKDWLYQYFTSSFTLDYTDFTYGTALPGSLRLFKALGFLLKEYFHAREEVKREHIIAGSGCSAVIDSLVSCIADEGDGILVARPFYNGFSASFECRNRVQAVGVALPEGREGDPECIELFEKALEESEAKGTRIRGVMVCNPNNPLGFCYSRETLVAYCRFAEKYNIHLIVDEIYALSTYVIEENEDLNQFTSILAIDTLSEAQCNPARVHGIYGASKDWGVNGFRLGALISQHNPHLHVAMESSCLLMKVSSVADSLWSNLILDPVALPKYLELNRANLAKAYTIATTFLKAHSIPYRSSNAGHFIFIDLRSFLPQATTEGVPYASEIEKEEALALHFNRHGINLNRGSAYAHPVVGYFRLTFTLRQDFFLVGLARLERSLNLESIISFDLVTKPASVPPLVDLSPLLETLALLPDETRPNVVTH